MDASEKDKRRLRGINFIILLTIVFFLAGLISLAVHPTATSYLGWLFSGSCFILAFLMIRRNILKKLKR